MLVARSRTTTANDWSTVSDNTASCSGSTPFSLCSMSATFITASVILSTISPWMAESSIIGATVFTYESVFKIWFRDHTATTEAASNTPLSAAIPIATLVRIFLATTASAVIPPS